MRKPISFLGALMLAAAGAAAASAQTCLKADDKVEAAVTGTLATVRFIHPGNGSRQTAYVVNLARPVCADVTDIDDKVERVSNIRRVQLAGDFAGQPIQQLMGKRVIARGTLFGQHTAYHIAPILVSLKSLEAAK
ncbi:MAG TPA: hypothetical protein VIF14_00070 [Alphaproteobacteria bacterium]